MLASVSLPLERRGCVRASIPLVLPTAAGLYDLGFYDTVAEIHSGNGCAESSFIWPIPSVAMAPTARHLIATTSGHKELHGHVQLSRVPR
ncbi:hypothetical protein PG993_002498 [Apiospora rasikravindrae]|uniref:Uncharacterized protein n=1 Tax=Apiospora rasikravindrae TaxID=990691 RepID=A0ABR1TX24_9PEZI